MRDIWATVIGLLVLAVGASTCFLTWRSRRHQFLMIVPAVLAAVLGVWALGVASGGQQITCGPVLPACDSLLPGPPWS